MLIQRISPTEVAVASAGTTVRLTDSKYIINDYIINGPGEYDVAGVAFDVGVGYALIHLEQLRVLVLEPSHPQLVAESIAQLEGVDCVIVPAESDPARQKAVTNLLHDLEPRGVVVLGSAEDAKALAGQTVEPTNKLKFQLSDLEGEELRVWAVGPVLA